jgi:hypothetical protein
MKTHHVWWPHLDRAPMLNPFVPGGMNPRSTGDRIEFREIEEEQGDEESPAPQADDRPQGDK